VSLASSSYESISRFGAQIATGTTSSGVAAINTTQTFLNITSFKLIHQYRDVAVSDLSDGTNTYTAIVGHGHPNATSTGAYFRYTHSVNGGRWQAVTTNGGVETATDTGISPLVVSGGVGQRMTIVLVAGTNAKFYIDGVLVATNTTNLPNSGYSFPIGMGIKKTAGTTERFIYVRQVYAKYFDL
jgi:hypothetical protein